MTNKTEKLTAKYNKAPRIQNALRHIQAVRGALTLDFLADLPLDQAKTWLTQIKGVGPKTAAIVLLFAFGRPAFPVDTHVHRILKRVGLIDPHISADKAHEIMENSRYPETRYPETFYAMHLNLIQHGREVCQARLPKCQICPLQRRCDFYQAQSS